MNLFIRKLEWILVLSFIFPYSVKIWSRSKSENEYTNPLPNSIYVSINTNIVIRRSGVISAGSIDNNLIETFGSRSGIHHGKIILAKDSRTIVFTPYSPFQTDEDVTVRLNDGLISSDNNDSKGFSYKFHTSRNTNTTVSENKPVHKNKIFSVGPKAPSNFIKDPSIPPDLPPINIDISNNPSPGYYFLSASPYIEIADNHGTPVFYQNAGETIYDFDLQPNGELTYFIYPVTCIGMDSSFNYVQNFGTVNGFTPDVHELRVLPNGNYYIFGKRNVSMDMSKIVQGGDPSADIIDGALQEFDSNGNLIFQWDALDHYKITDVDSAMDLTQATIDFTHFNALEIDTDGNLLISARNLDEITKVNQNTGDIIWRWGGKNNQFKLINDDFGFSRQHDIRRFSNGDLSLFDNGFLRADQVSSAVEYKVDEINLTVTLVRRIYHENIYTETEGNVEELPNGNRLICWGQNASPFLSEITPQDSTAFDLSYQYYVDSYRAFKYPWETNLFTTNTDSINFGNFTNGVSSVKQFTVYNPHTSAVTISEFYCSDSSISTSISTPVTIQPRDSLVVPVIFKPTQDSTFSVSFNIRNITDYDGSPMLIARQVILSGKKHGLTSVNSGSVPRQYELSQNYPNPFNPATIINYQIQKSGLVSLKVYDILGKEVKTLVSEYKQAGVYSINFNAANLSSGVYFYQLISGDYSSIKKMVVLK